MSASSYERELKSILRGDEVFIRGIIRTCSDEEKEKYLSILKKPFVVIRAAGSYGIDLVAVREDISMVIEIKSSVSDKIHFSSIGGKLQRQAENMRKECERAGVIPIYAFRLKNHRGDAWRLFTLDIDGLKGKMKQIYNRIPKLGTTKNNNIVMRWSDGMPLSDFIDIVAK